VRNAFDRYMGYLQKDEFPAELWKRVENLRTGVHSEPTTRESASKCLDQIWSIYDEVAEAYYSRFGKSDP